MPTQGPEPQVVNEDAAGEWNPGRKYRVLLVRIQNVLSTGEERTVRDVYYALESRGHKYDYRKVKRAVKKGRRAGYVPPGLIYDASRSAETIVSERYDDPQDFLDRVIRESWTHYDENLWRGQDTYVEVWLEKQSLASVFAPVCQEWNVRLEATRGDWSDSKVYEAAHRLRDRLAHGNDVSILYFGDFNPSGYHAPVSTLERLRYYGLDLERGESSADERAYYDPEGRTVFCPAESDRDLCSFELERVGLNLEHIRKYDLPENPNPSSTDKDKALRRGFQNYVSAGRDTNVELNALKEFHRDDLERLLRGAIRSRVDEDALSELNDRIERAQDALEQAIRVDDDALPEEFRS